MGPATEHRSSTALTNTLSERVFTRSGSNLDPREDVWEWTDGPFQARIDFNRYPPKFRVLVPFLKQVFLPFLKRHSSGYLLTLNQEFYRLAKITGDDFDGMISTQLIYLQIVSGYWVV